MYLQKKYIYYVHLDIDTVLKFREHLLSKKYTFLKTLNNKKIKIYDVYNIFMLPRQSLKNINIFQKHIASIRLFVSKLYIKFLCIEDAFYNNIKTIPMLKLNTYFFNKYFYLQPSFLMLCCNILLYFLSKTFWHKKRKSEFDLLFERISIYYSYFRKQHSKLSVLKVQQSSNLIDVFCMSRIVTNFTAVVYTVSKVYLNFLSNFYKDFFYLEKKAFIFFFFYNIVQKIKEHININMFFKNE